MLDVEHIKSLVERGMAASNSGHYDVAEKMLAEADQLQKPYYPVLKKEELKLRAKILLYRAFCKLTFGQIEEADSFYSEALSIHCNSELLDTLESQRVHIWLLLSRAHVRRDSGDLQAAEIDLSMAIDFQSESMLLDTQDGQAQHIKLLGSRANLRAQMGRPKEAVEDYSLAIDRHSQYNLQSSAEAPQILVSLLLNRGMTYDNLRLLQEALADYSRALELQQAHQLYRSIEGVLTQVKLLLNRGNVFLDLDFIKEAEKDYSEALKIQSDNQILLDSIEGLKVHIELLIIRAKLRRSLNRYDEAERDLSDAFAVIDSYDPLFESEEDQNVRVDVLMNRGLSRKDLGRLNEALEDFCAALDLQQTRPLESNIEVQKSYIELLGNRGNAQMLMGLLAEAESDFTQALKFQLQYQRLSDIEDQLLHVSLRMNRATVCFLLGKPEEARKEYTAAIDFQTRHKLLNTASGLDTHVNLRMNLALVWHSLDKKHEADQEFTATIDFLVLHFRLASFASQKKHVYLLVNRANVRMDLGFLQLAETDCDEALTLVEKYKLITGVDGQQTQAKLFGNRGVLRQQQGRLTDAEEDFIAAFDSLQKYHLTDRMEGRQIKLRLLINLAMLKLEQKQVTSAWGNIATVVEQLCELSSLPGIWWSQQARRLISWPKSNGCDVLNNIFIPLEKVWLRRMQSKHVSEYERKHFVEFMQAYLVLAFDLNRRDLLPGIMALLQGRKLLEMVMTDIDENGNFVDLTDEQVARRRSIRQLRKEIEMLRIRMAGGAESEIGGFGQITFGDGENNRFMGTNHKQAEMHFAKEKTEYVQLEDLYNALQAEIKADPELAELSGVVPVTAGVLQQRLEPGQAVILLATGPHESKTLYAAVTFAGEDGGCQAVRLGSTSNEMDLLLLAEHMASTKNPLHNARSLSFRHGYLWDGQPETSLELPNQSEPVDSAYYEIWVNQYFWHPLLSALLDQGCAEEYLLNISTWHICVSGALAHLPFAESVPHVNCIVHLALPFFLKYQEASNDSIPQALSTHAGLGSQAGVIPAVLLESSLLQCLWGECPPDARLSTEQVKPVGIAHFSCHGEHNIKDPMSSCLLLNNERQETDLWTARDVLQAQKTPKLAVLSACLAGRITEDSDSDPMGLVTALMLRNTQHVIGALVPVPDGAMCWFGVLLQWHLHQNIKPRQALNETQLAFRHAQWPEGFVEFLRLHLRDSLDQTLKTIKQHCPHRQENKAVNSVLLTSLMPSTAVDRSMSIEVTEKTYPNKLDMMAGIILGLFENPDRANYPEEYSSLPNWVRGFGL